jgi:hypothetical protein
MKNKIILASLIIIILYGCTKEDSNMRVIEDPKLTPKELVIGK